MGFSFRAVKETWGESWSLNVNEYEAFFESLALTAQRLDLTSNRDRYGCDMEVFTVEKGHEFLDVLALVENKELFPVDLWRPMVDDQDGMLRIYVDCC